MQKILISNNQVRAEFQPQWGGLLSALQFNLPKQNWVDAFVTESQKPVSGNGIPFFGCFLMVPFANRLFDGVAQTETGRFEFPLQLEQENLAIHGTGWDQPWDVIDHKDNQLTMVHAWASSDSRYAFETQLHAHLQGSTLHLKLILTNLADGVLPMGMGFHPWFSDIDHSEVRFEDELTANRESPWSKYPSPDFKGLPKTFNPALFNGLDSTFDGWNKRAQIVLKSKGLLLEMSADGATDTLHAFVMEENDRFCLEPVSHKPGDLNRSKCQVQPGQTITGSMHLTGTAI